MLVRGTHFLLSLGAKGFNTVSAVESLSDLLIRVDEALKLGVELDVLAGKHVTVVLKGVHLGAHVGVVVLHRLSAETQIVLLAL